MKFEQIVACTNCKKQYRVKPEHVGKQFHCACQAVIKVPTPIPQTASILHCASCGAGVSKDDEKCLYCENPIPRSQKVWTGLCPSCFSRLPAEAGYCPNCATAIEAESLDDKDSDFACPRCEIKLFVRQFANRTLHECHDCGGLWIHVDIFHKIMKEGKNRDVDRMNLSRQDKKGLAQRKSEKPQRAYIPCPECKQIMNQKNFGGGSGTIVDYCRDHGVWLDNWELEQILEWVEDGGNHRLFSVQRRSMRPGEAQRPAWKSSLEGYPKGRAEENIVTQLLDGLLSLLR
ncbi:zf-TFIIB domain-containing protein [Thermodesulfobacteriota bacterium]